MGLVNSPAFPTSVAPEDKPKKAKKVVVEPLVEPTVPEECCALGCDDCEHAQKDAE